MSASIIFISHQSHTHTLSKIFSVFRIKFDLDVIQINSKTCSVSFCLPGPKNHSILSFDRNITYLWTKSKFGCGCGWEMIIILTPTPFFWQPEGRRKRNGSSRPAHTSFTIMKNCQLSAKTFKKFGRGKLSPWPLPLMRSLVTPYHHQLFERQHLMLNHGSSLDGTAPRKCGFSVFRHPV
jgi:hypothetical protein